MTLKKVICRGGVQSVVDMTPYDIAARLARQPSIEQSYLEKRQWISDEIYRISRSYIDNLQNGYASIEAIRWEADKAAIEVSDWSRFTGRCGSTLTPQQYAETRVVPKITAGDAFIDDTIAKRTDLHLALDACLDADLDSFDYTSIWDEASDYTPPPVEEVEVGWWDGLMSSIPWNYKF